MSTDSDTSILSPCGEKDNDQIQEIYVSNKILNKWYVVPISLCFLKPEGIFLTCKLNPVPCSISFNGSPLPSGTF